MPSGVVQSRPSSGLSLSSALANAAQSSRVVFGKAPSSSAIVFSRTRYGKLYGACFCVYDGGRTQGVAQDDGGGEQQHGAGLMRGGERDRRHQQQGRDA